MNAHQIMQYMRQRLGDMTDRQRDEFTKAVVTVVGQSIEMITSQAGKSFLYISAELIAKELKQNPASEAKVKELVQAVPELAGELLWHLDAPWLTEAAARQPAVKRPKRSAVYLREAMEKRDAAEDRWLALKEKIAAAEKAGDAADQKELANLRVQEFIAHAEFCAGCHTTGDVHFPVRAHLREQRDYCLVEMLARLADPTAGSAEPTVDVPGARAKHCQG